MRKLSTSVALVFTLALTLPACGGGEGGKVNTGGTSGAASGGLVGSAGPDFTADSVNGMGKVSLAANKGKVTIVDFWATWCEPCKKSFPKLEELNVKYKDKLVILAVSEDDENNRIADFGKTHGAKFPLIWDKEKAIAGKWSPPGMPTTFIVDKTGTVKFIHQGYHDGEELEIEKEVKSLL
jgi:cytochrome c biogenesis protein CcmG, thiol:disulfide interchange protein DsbE